MNPDETVTYYQYVECDDLPQWEFYIRVDCYIDPGQDGATGPYGEPLEPSWGPCVEDIEPVEMKFIDGNWHDYDYFVDKWNLEDEIEFDFEELFELCNDKSVPNPY